MDVFWRELEWRGKGSSNKDILHMNKINYIKLKIYLLHTLLLHTILIFFLFIWGANNAIWSYSPPTPIPDTCKIYTHFHIFPNFLYFFKIAHWFQFVFSIYSWMWSHIWDHGLPDKSDPYKNWLSLSRRHHLSTDSQWEMGSMETFLLHARMLTNLILNVVRGT